MKTLQIKAGRWFAIPGPDGDVSYHPVVPGETREQIAREIDELDPPDVREVIGTGIRLYDVVQLEGEEWKLYDNDAQAIAALAFRIRETT